MELDTIPQGGQSSAPHPLPEGEDISEGPAAPPHPTAEQIDRLFAVAAACREPKELQGRRLREVMGLSGKARTTKKLLRESMTPALYTVSLSHNEQMLKRQIEEELPMEPNRRRDLYPPMRRQQPISRLRLHRPPHRLRMRPTDLM
jgi:hypothetical protein